MRHNLSRVDFEHAWMATALPKQGHNWLKMKTVGPKRGGPRRNAGAIVEVDALTNALTQGAGCVADMGVYNSLGRNCQPCGKGLLQLATLIQLFLDICPCFELNPGCLLKALTNLVFKQPAMNQTIYSTKVWVGQKQERLTNMMYHLRRLRREDDRLQQVCMLLGSAEVNLLKNLVDQVKLSSSEKSSLHESRSALDSQSQTETAFYPEGAGGGVEAKKTASKNASPKKAASKRSSSPKESDSQKQASGRASPSAPRKLLRKASEASQDSNGFPRMLKDLDDVVGPEVKRAKHTQETAASSSGMPNSPGVARDESFVALMGFQPKAQPKAKVNRAKAKSKSTAKAVATPKAHSKAKAKTKATPRPAELEETLKTLNISSYDQAKAAWTGSPQEWLESSERRSAVDSMGRSEVQRRRFEHLRPDLFTKGEGSKWVRK
jgi:hypothetical protein